MTSDSTTEPLNTALLAWMENQMVPIASKQLMIDVGLNVFGFDLAMESFHRAEHRDRLPAVFAYEHEDGVLVFIQRPEQRHERG